MSVSGVAVVLDSIWFLVVGQGTSVRTTHDLCVLDEASGDQLLRFHE